MAIFNSYVKLPEGKERCRIYLRSANEDHDRCWRNGQSQTNQRAFTWDSQLRKMVDKHASPHKLANGVSGDCTGQPYVWGILLRWRWDVFSKWDGIFYQRYPECRLSKDLKPYDSLFGDVPQVPFFLVLLLSPNSIVSVCCWSPNDGRSNRWWSKLEHQIH